MKINFTMIPSNALIKIYKGVCFLFCYNQLSNTEQQKLIYLAYSMLFHTSSKFDFIIGVDMVMYYALICVNEIHQL